MQAISIHALREEGDLIHAQLAAVKQISIHALREEGDHQDATPAPHSRYFYPRPPRGGRRAEDHIHCAETDISIHALREEGDLEADLAQDNCLPFLSTPSARRATGLDRLREGA